MHPETWLIQYGRKYPDAWKKFDELRAQRKSLGDWPAWCFCPLAGAYAIVCPVGRLSFGPQVGDIAILGALGAWRPAKGVFEFSESLEDALWGTPITGQIPSDILLRLPEWCPYVLLQNPREGMIGFWVHLEFDSHDHRTELRLLMDFGDGLVPAILHIGGGATVEEAFDRAMSEGEWQAKLAGIHRELPRIPAIKNFMVVLGGIVSLTLYLCAKNAEIRPGNVEAKKAEEPGFPEPTRTRKGERLYPPDTPRRWECGWRIGPTLDAAIAREKSLSEGEHSGPRPHLRRAHWHTYWVGTGRERQEVKWLHPILVGTDETVPTVRKVN